MPESEPGSQTAQNWNPALSETELATVLVSMGQVEQQLPFLIGLSRDERSKLAKVGDRTRPFLQDAIDTALANTGLLPRSVDIDQLRTRAATLRHLSALRARLAQLLEKVNDSETRLGSELYGVTRTVYTVMKTASAVPGLNEQKARLARRFARKAKSRPEQLPTAA